MQTIDRDQQDMLGVRLPHIMRIIVIGIHMRRQTACKRGEYSEREVFLGGHGILLWDTAMRRPGHAMPAVCRCSDPRMSPW
jgi:hypothetical protein